MGKTLRKSCLAILLLVPLTARAQAPAPASAPAHLLHGAPPKAPPLEVGETAEVVLTLSVDAEGRVSAVKVLSTGGAPFDAAAVAAARNFVFAPAREEGHPVPTTVTYRSRFVGPQSPPEELAEPLIGTVRSRGDRLGRAGVHLIIDNNLATASTDADGHFVIEGLRVGKHVIHVRGTDFPPVDQVVDLRVDVPTVREIFIEEKPRYLSQVHTHLVASDSVQQTISGVELRHVAGTQGDALKAVQNLPGVARPPFNGGLLAVWGSAPGDTRVYIDGVAIPTLYHFGGIRSTLNSALVQSLTLLPGGYDVSHGRGLGGVVELETDAPKQRGLHGFVQIDLADVSGLIEGKFGSRFSFSAGFRVSWLEFFIEALASHGAASNLIPKYWDYQLALHYRASPKDALDLFFLGSNDTMTLWVPPSEGLGHHFDQVTFFHRALFRWHHRFGRGATLTVTPSVGYDVPYGVDVTWGNANFWHHDRQLGYSLRAAAHWPLGRLLDLDFGLDYEGTRSQLDARENLGGQFREGDADLGQLLGYSEPDRSGGVATDRMTVYTNHTAPFVALTLALFHRRLLVMPQLRLETMTFFGHPRTPAHFSSHFVFPEPRLALRLRIVPRVTLQGSIGRYHQAPLSSDFSSVFGNPLLRPESGTQYVLGVELKLPATLAVEVQGFYKDLRDLVGREPLLSDPPLGNDGVGRVFGGQVLLRQPLWHHFYGWISYTVSRSERRDHPGAPWRPFQYDQTHILTLLGSYQLPHGFQVGLRFRYVTGNPYTPVASTFYDVNSSSYIPSFGAPYSGRLPSFHQLDLRVDKTVAFNHWRLVAYADIQNVYNATSAEGVVYSYDYKKKTYLSGIPILPLIGLRGEY